ncbi:MAG: acetamidase/formamidase family protein [Anaerolineaceae bacterium]|nr:acetamidase/formamidase family protein [Anaerolineaceae bacterium]
MVHYTFGLQDYHLLWDESHKPLQYLKEGDTVSAEISDFSNGLLNLNSTVADLTSLDFDKCYPLAGPFYMEGAEPGDTLAVEVLDVQPRGWGWMAVLPGMGLLSQDFTEPYFRTFDLSNGRYVPFRENIRIPLAPFFGTMGVCPKGARQLAVMPPGNFGGNMDTRHIRKGSTLYLPVQVEGALFSIGDGHCAQGDGEVCVTALEAPLGASLRFNLLKGRHLRAPRFTTASPLLPELDGRGFFSTLGVENDLYRAAQMAIRDMVSFIAERYQMSPIDAYLLASLCVDLKITQIVDAGIFSVAATLPLSIFSE